MRKLFIAMSAFLCIGALSGVLTAIHSARSSVAATVPIVSDLVETSARSEHTNDTEAKILSTGVDQSLSVEENVAAKSPKDRFNVSPVLQEMLLKSHSDLPIDVRLKTILAIVEALQRHLPDGLSAGQKSRLLASVGLMATDISRADFRQEVGLLGITHKAELSGAVFATLCDQGLVDFTPAETNMEVYKSTLDEALIGLYGSLDNLPAEVAENMDPDVHAESINYFEPMFQFPLSEEAQSRLSANLQTVITSAQQEIQHYLDSPELADMTADEQSERISHLYSRHAQQIRNLVYAAYRDSVPTEFWEQVGSSLSADFHRDSVRLQELRMLQMQEMRPIHDASE